MTAPSAGFRDPTNLTRTTKGFLYASIPLILVAVASSAREYWWLSNRGDAAPPLAAPFESLAALALAMVALVGLGTAITVLMWIHRASYNARQLGATRMEFTPGWAVGWYFIPIAWFWKPYQAMKEICRASFNPSRWWEEDAPSLLPAWWALWLITSFGAGGVSWTVSTEVAESASTLIGELLRIPLTLVLLHIINQVHRMQMSNYRTQAVE